MKQTFAKKPAPKPASTNNNSNFDDDDGRPAPRGRLRGLLKGKTLSDHLFIFQISTELKNKLPQSV